MNTETCVFLVNIVTTIYAFARQDYYSGCGGPKILSTSSNGFITSQIPFNETSEYESNSWCQWRVRISTGYIIHLTSLSFELEPDSSCSYDFLAVYDGDTKDSPLLGRFCGDDTVNIYSTGPYLFIEFVSDDDDNYHGFELEYRVTTSANCSGTEFRCPSGECIPLHTFCDGKEDCLDGTDENFCASSKPQSCTKELTGSMGHFTSPNYPQDYPNDTDCLWDIRVPSGKNINLTFADKFALEEPHSVCDMDRISVYSADVNGSMVFVDEFCGNKSPGSLIVRSERMIVKFHSDAGGSFMGFNAFWEAGDNIDDVNTTSGNCVEEIYYTQPGVIQTPHFLDGKGYSNNLNCIWRIYGPPGHVIRVTFGRIFGIEGSHGCQYDRLMLYDGPSAGDKLIAKMCGRSPYHHPREELSTGSTMMVSFYSDGIFISYGFNLTYEAVRLQAVPVDILQPCMVNKPFLVSEDREGEITSPYFDGLTNYPNNLDCEWEVIAPEGKVVTFYFNKFELEEDIDCAFDFLMFSEFNQSYSTREERFCGYLYPASYTSASNNPLLRFVTDRSKGGFGFNISFIIHEPIQTCGENNFRCNDTKCIPHSSVCDHHQDCPDGSDEIACDNTRNCGVPAIKPINYHHKIVGGTEATPGSLPWQMSIRYAGIHVCGGVLINPQWVLTSAHCFKKSRSPADYGVFGGKHHFIGHDDHQEGSAINKIILHKDFVPSTLDNDVAMVKLTTQLNLTDYINTLCLPSSLVPDDTICLTSGWGKTLGTGNEGLLKQVYLPVTNSDVCNNTRNIHGRLTDNMLCAGNLQGGEDTCQGDSGGALACNIHGRWQVQGLVSWGEGCGEPDSPGVYTKVINYVTWIRETISMEDMDKIILV